MIWTPRKKIVTSRHKQRGNFVISTEVILQNITFDPARAHPNVTLSNGDRTMVSTVDGNWWYAVGYLADSKVRASGGKFMYEVTVDSMPTTLAFVSFGWANANLSGIDVILAGNRNGGALLIDDENGTLSRVYYGSSASTFANTANPAFPQDAGGSVFTCGIDLDNQLCSFYMDGSAIEIDRAWNLDGGEDTGITFCVKSFSKSVVSLNPTIQHPISGYEVWG